MDEMGGGSSTEMKREEPSSEEQERERDDQININVLYSALQKLSFAFEVKESLTTSLTEEILHPVHKTFDDKLFGVEEWLRKFTDVDLTHEEIYHLIKYVEVFQSSPKVSEAGTKDTLIHSDSVASSSEAIPSDNLNFAPVSRAESLNSQPGRSDSLPSQTLAPVDENISDDKFSDVVYPSLACPYRSNIGRWIIAIRSAEQIYHTSGKENNTPHISSETVQSNDLRVSTLKGKHNST